MIFNRSEAAAHAGVQKRNSLKLLQFVYGLVKAFDSKAFRQVFFEYNQLFR